MRTVAQSAGLFLRAALAAVAIACFAGTALAQSVVDRAKVLLREGNAAKAFELLDPVADQLNDAESAYLHGISALDSGKAGLAIISFERALAYDPGFAPARAELVRALVATGETDQARIELARLANVQVPPEVRQKLAVLDTELALGDAVLVQLTQAHRLTIQGRREMLAAVQRDQCRVDRILRPAVWCGPE